MKRSAAIMGLATSTLIVLSGCAGNVSSQSAATSTGVAATQVALTAAEKAATTYARLPQCPASAPVCSEAATIAQIKAADNTAYAAVKTARKSGADPDVLAANVAIAALVGMIPSPAPAAPSN